jgi:hypothetical protein
VGHEQKRAEILRQILLDKDAEYGDRSDALTALSELNPEFLESDLLNMARDRSEDEELVEDAGDALGLMWVKFGQIPIAKIRGMFAASIKNDRCAFESGCAMKPSPQWRATFLGRMAAPVARSSFTK